MTDTRHDGGPAFPRDESHDDGSLYMQHPGMTLRDWFASKAPITEQVVMQVTGIRDLGTTNDSGRGMFFAVWAALRFEYADAMLAERDRR